MIALAIVGCEKDKIGSGSEIKKPLKIRTISFKDFKKYSNNFDVQKQFSSKTNAGKNSKDSSGIHILTNKIVMYQNDSVTNYTFKLSSIDSTEAFYNLIITLNQDNTLNDYHVLKYTPDSVWLQDRSQPFSGSVMAVHDVLGDNQIDDLLLKFYGCVTGLSIHWKCKANKNHSPDDMVSNGGVCQQTEFTQYFTLEWGECSGGASGGSTITIPPNSYTYNYGTGTGGVNGNAIIIGTQTLSTQSWEEVLTCAQGLLQVDGAVELLIDNKPLADEFESYLDDNNCSPEAQEFVELAAEALQDNNNDGEPDGEVDFEESIIFDNTWHNYSCQKSIVKDTNSGYGDIGSSIEFLFGENPNVSLEYTHNNIDSSSGFTVAGKTNVEFDELANLTNIIITFDTFFLEHATDLAIFTIGVHENLHAISALLLEIDLININTDDFDLSSLAEEYAEKKALILIDQYEEYDASDEEFLEHEAISELVDLIAFEIKAYGESKGYVIDDFHYEALAWSGLNGTIAFTVMDEDIQNAINNIIEYEGTNFEILAEGQPCN